MRMSRYAVRASLLLVLLLACARAAHPCTCSGPGTRKAFRQSSAVFLGRIVEMGVNEDRSFEPYPYRVRFAVEKRWKGDGGSEITALSYFDMPGMCGDLKLEVGESYLIFAERERGTLLFYPECGPNLKAADAAEEIKKLNSFRFRLFARLYPHPF